MLLLADEIVAQHLALLCEMIRAYQKELGVHVTMQCRIYIQNTFELDVYITVPTK
jgi:hypothetical protein